MTRNEIENNYRTLDRTDISIEDKVEIMLRLHDEDIDRLENYLVKLKCSLVDKAKILVELAKEQMWFIEGVIGRLTSKEKIYTIKRIAETKEDEVEYLMHCIEDTIMELTPYERIYLILETIEKAPEKGLENFQFYCKQCESIELPIEYLIYVISELGYKDIEAAKRCLEHLNYKLNLDMNDIVDGWDIAEQIKQKYPEFNFAEFAEKTDIMMIIFEDVEEAKEQLKNSRLSFKDKVELICKIAEQDPEYARKLDDLAPNSDNIEQITLPKGMTIGIEIETEGDDIYRGEILGWRAVKDASLGDGETEVVSPVLNKNNNKDIYFICNILKIMERRISDACAGHIHIGANYLYDQDQWVKLRNLWLKIEEIMYIISNPKGTTIRKNIIDYAKPLNIQKDAVQIDDEDSLRLVYRKFKDAQKGERTYAVNFNNLGDQDKNTIEFRMPNGTLEPEVWIQNINLYGSLLVAVRQVDEIEKSKRNGENITDEQLDKLQLFQTILSQDMEDDDKIQKLLDLIFTDEMQKQIYRDRYKSNKSKFWRSSIGREFKELYKKQDQQGLDGQSDGGR